MKKLKIALLFVCAYTTSVYAQYYGQRVFSSTSPMVLSSAQSCNIHSDGYVMGMYNNAASITTWPIYVRKTDKAGNYSSTLDHLSTYAVTKNNNCTINTTAPDRCYGVSVIETGSSTTPVTGSNYAMVATLSGPSSGNFCIFATIDQAGLIVNKAFYDLPSTATSPSKPLITESIATPGKYYITGSYNDSGLSATVMYIVCVNVSGTILWSKTYQAGLLLNPFGVLESPYNSGELVIAGICIPDPSLSPFLNLANEGFFMKVNSSAGNVLLMNVYGEDASVLACNEFHCITAAASTAGGTAGFVLAGHSDPIQSNPSKGYSWMIKLAPNGNVLWNTTLGNLTTIQIDQVIERKSTVTGAYEYYGSAVNTNPTVFRVNANGTLHSGNNYYEYNYISTFSADVYITDVNNNTPVNGIQVYSTDPSTNMDNYFVKAYFDGNSGCNDNLGNTGQGPGPSEKYALNVSTSTGLSSYVCSGFNVTTINSTNTESTNILCAPASIPGASNARTTGIGEIKKDESGISVHPNPVADKTTLSFQSAANDHVKVEVFNSLGQLVKTVHESTSAAAGSQDLEIDFNTLNVKAGIYFIHTTVNSNTNIQKLVYNK